MPRALFACAGLLVLSLAHSAQAQVRANAPVDVLGQVYAPGGGQLPKAVRVHFTAGNGMRPPEIIFTDSNGRFVVYSVIQGEEYTLTVDAEEPNWGLTIVNFIPIGRRPGVQVYLNPYAKPRSPVKGDSVSIASLRSDIPRGARKEFQAGMKHAQHGQYDKARKRFEKAVQAYPNFVEARNELAVTLMKEGDVRAAEQQLREALRIDSTAVMPLMNLGLCMYRQERYAAAAVPLERAVQLDNDNYRAHLLLGMTLVMAGDDPRAEANLLRAYALGGASAARAQFYLSHYYTRRHSYAEAAHALAIYLQDAPNDPDARELGRTLARLRATSSRN